MPEFHLDIHVARSCKVYKLPITPFQVPQLENGLEASIFNVKYVDNPRRKMNDITLSIKAAFAATITMVQDDDFDEERDMLATPGSEKDYTRDTKWVFCCPTPADSPY